MKEKQTGNKPKQVKKSGLRLNISIYRLMSD
jgi:hypothetical protein